MLPSSRASPAPGRQTTETVEISRAGTPPRGESARDPTLQPGDTIGARYTVLGVLGSGGFAVVYRAFDRELQQEVALKVLRADRITPEALGRFRREAVLARDAVSERLVRIFDIGRSDPAVFLTMERVDGGSLAQRLASGPLPIAEAVRLATQALEGLHALHQLRIVHRDVKPGNVLLTQDGRVKLADFGLARQLGEDESRLTRDGALLGTLPYLSPEQALDEEVDARSDLYSLGVVLFEMLTGHLPHEGRSALGTLLGHLKEKTPDVRTWRPEIPPWLAAVVARLLARFPEARYPSAAAVLADLAARTAPVRRRRSIWLAGAMLVALLALAIPVARQRWTPRHFSHLVERPREGVAAIGRDGEELWKSPGSQLNAFASARLSPGAAPVLVGILHPVDTAANHTLSVLDPETGRELRSQKLRDGAEYFPEFAPTFYPALEAVDLDGDGVDEILVNYTHGPLWPSYVVLYEPRIGRTRIVFVASGHHRFVGAVDLDGDGRRELLMAGINNRMGWYTGIAAVRLVPPVNDPNPAEKAVATSPDSAYDTTSSRSLLWYTLGRRERFLDLLRPCHTTASTRQIDCAYEGGAHLRLDFDGLPLDPPSPRPAVERRAARERAYRELREATRLLAGGDPAESLPSAELAVQDAEQVGDDRLRDWVERVRARTLVGMGRLVEGKNAFEHLARSSEAASDVCFDAAKALHLAGDLAPAVAWYRRGLGLGSTRHTGRGKWEYLEGEVLALAELSRFAEARAEIQRFADLYPEDNTFLELFKSYLRWREGEVPPVAGLRAGGDPDLERYLLLELRRAAGADPQQLLGEIEADLPKSSEAAPELLSLKGEVLARLGRSAEALVAARDGLQLALVQRRVNTGVRAHFDLIAERAARLTRAAGG